MMMGILLCVIVLFILFIMENVLFMSLIVEVCLVFGMTGLLIGVMFDLIIVGKFVFIVFMFIGCVGILIFILVSGGRE